MAAPTENDIKQIQKVDQVQTRLLAPKITVKKNPGDGSSNFLAMPQKGSSAMLSKSSINQVSNTSLGDKRVTDQFVRPVALKEKTQMSLANQRANPRPPSSSGRKAAAQSKLLAQNSSGDSNYSEDNYDNDFDENEDKEADLKLEKLRKAMKRENVTAAKVVTKANIQVLRQPDGAKPTLKMGPATGKGGITMA